MPNVECRNKKWGVLNEKALGPGLSPLPLYLHLALSLRL